MWQHRWMDVFCMALANFSLLSIGLVFDLGAAEAPDPWRALQIVPRVIPSPLPDHPGNIYLEGESVAVRIPKAAKGAVSWRVVDDRGETITEGKLSSGAARLNLGALGIGWYRVNFLDANKKEIGWTTAAVLHPLAAPTPQDSPICVDSASAWFATRYGAEEKHAQETYASLAALCGCNWIRDRLSWGEIEPARGVFQPKTRYDSSASIQTMHGLKTLQVFHRTPDWAADPALDGQNAGKRFPRNLMDSYDFCRAMAKRFKGHVFAWEPWNEANIGGFGGMLINEMCSLQKASYLGFKSGDPKVTVCWNVFAGAGNDLQTEGVLLNETWPYFDTYNIHSYSAPQNYLEQFRTARRAACGKPIWISECGIRLRTETPAPWGDMSQENELQQAAFIARSYASSLYAGVNRHFFFILGNYIEGAIQFGLLRHDFTPRPGFCALAAVGRFLAGARCIGQWEPKGTPRVRVVAFSAQPEGHSRDVLVVWAEKTRPWSLPKGTRVEKVYDYFGRPLGTTSKMVLGQSALFIVLPPGEAQKLPLQPLPEKAAPKPGTPSPIVLQVQMPFSCVRLRTQSYEIDGTGPADIPIDVYNFSDQSAAGTIKIVDAPDKWKIAPKQWDVHLGAKGKRQIVLRVDLGGGTKEAIYGAWIKLRGDFGKAGQPALAFRLSAPITALKPSAIQPIEQANDPKAWRDNIVGGARMSHRAAPHGGVLFEMQFADTDPWCFPKLSLTNTMLPPADCDGLRLTVQVPEGQGHLSVQFIEKNGASYIVPLELTKDIRTPQAAVALFRNASWGPWSQPDPDRRLDIDQIRVVLVGINSVRNSKAEFIVRDLAWVKY